MRVHGLALQDPGLGMVSISISQTLLTRNTLDSVGGGGRVTVLMRVMTPTEIAIPLQSIHIYFGPLRGYNL